MSGLENFFNSFKQASKVRTFWALSAIGLSLVGLIYFTVLKMDIFNILTSDQTSEVVKLVLNYIFIIVIMLISLTFIFYTIKMFKPLQKNNKKKTITTPKTQKKMNINKKNIIIIVGSNNIILQDINAKDIFATQNNAEGIKELEQKFGLKFNNISKISDSKDIETEIIVFDLISAQSLLTKSLYSEMKRFILSCFEDLFDSYKNKKNEDKIIDLVFYCKQQDKMNYLAMCIKKATPGYWKEFVNNQ